jgi:hypothetical protein
MASFTVESWYTGRSNFAAPTRYAAGGCHPPARRMLSDLQRNTVRCRVLTAAWMLRPLGLSRVWRTEKHLRVSEAGDFHLTAPSKLRSRSHFRSWYGGRGGLQKWLRKQGVSCRQGPENLIVCYEKYLNMFVNCVEGQSPVVQRYPCAFLVYLPPFTLKKGGDLTLWPSFVYLDCVPKSYFMKFTVMSYNGLSPVHPSKYHRLKTA